MLTKFIMGVTNAIIIFAIYYTSRQAVDRKNDKYFGINVGIDEYPEILILIEKYERINKLMMFTLLFITAVSFIYTNSSYVLLTHFVVFLVAIVGGGSIVIRYTMTFDKILASDDDMMSKISVSKVRKVDLLLSNKAEEYKFTSVIYSLIIPFICCAYLVFKIVYINDVRNIEYSLRYLYITMLAVNILLMVASVIARKYIINMRQISYTDNREENIVINFNVKNTLINIMYIISNINVIANTLFVSLVIKTVIFSVAVSILSSIITILLIIYAYKNVKQVNYNEESSFGNWIYGIFYYNKADKKLSVPKRFGIGTTINLAKPMGKAILIATVVLIISVYSSAVYIIVGNEVVDHSLIISNEVMHMTSINYSKSISLAEVESVELVKKHDVHYTFKTNGISTESYRRGYFNVKGLGNCFVCVYSSSDTILKIKTVDGYLLYSTRTSEDTKAVYEELIYKINAREY